MNKELENIDYYFYVMVLRDGKQLPWIKIHNTGTSEILEKLSTLELRKSNNVKDLIDKITRATEKFCFYHFNLTLEIDVEETTIFEDSADSLPYKIKTTKLKEILSGWFEFLLAYENGEIPGIILPSNKIT